jgi:hypothetical protein
VSVTFTFAEYVEDPRFGTVLMCGADHLHVTCTEPDPCDDAAFYGSCAHADAAEAACGCTRFDVTVSYTSAPAVLDRLGLDPAEQAGSADPDDILGRALLANVGRDDSGVAPVTDQLPGRARFTDCGVRPGYFAEIMTALAALAAEAKARGVLIAWN